MKQTNNKKETHKEKQKQTNKQTKKKQKTHTHTQNKKTEASRDSRLIHVTQSVYRDLNHCSDVTTLQSTVNGAIYGDNP